MAFGEPARERTADELRDDVEVGFLEACRVNTCGEIEAVQRALVVRSEDDRAVGDVLASAEINGVVDRDHLVRIDSVLVDHYVTGKVAHRHHLVGGQHSLLLDVEDTGVDHVLSTAVE